MSIVPFAPAVRVPIQSGFDYVAVDATRRRVYAAHTGSRALLVVDADSGAVLGQVRVGPLHGVAVDEKTGHVFTGDGEARDVSEIDPTTLKVLRSAQVDGEVDAIAYDPATSRVFADEDEGTRLYVVDAATMTSIGTIGLPGHKPEYPVLDPVAHVLYQNIADLSEIAVIDPVTLKVTGTIPTPQIVKNHPLQFDAATGHLIVGGQNATIATYDTSGALVGSTKIQQSVDQCSFDPVSREVACAGSGKLTVLHDERSGPPTLVGQVDVAAGVHTVGIDSQSGRAWVVWSAPDGDFVQAFTIKP